MNIKFLNPFVEAAHEVLQAEAGLSITRGRLTLQKSALTTEDLTVLLGVVGQVDGVVLYGLSAATGLALVSRMMGQEFTELDSLAQSGIAELGNVITGRASVKLAEAGYVSNISPPTLVRGSNVRVTTLDFARIVVPLSSEVGDLTVNLALRDGREPAHASLGSVPTLTGILKPLEAAGQEARA